MTTTAVDDTTEGCLAPADTVPSRPWPTATRCTVLFNILVLTGCTLVDLGDIELPSCDPDECKALDKEEKNGCRSWHCPDAEGWNCVPSYLDGDGDGYPNAICKVIEDIETLVGKPLDCNDDDDSIFPGATEVCDLVDNDCDGSTDEGLFPLAQTENKRVIELIGLPNTSINDADCPRDDTFQLTVTNTQPSSFLGVMETYQDNSNGWIVDLKTSDAGIAPLDYFYLTDPQEDDPNDKKKCPTDGNNEKDCNIQQLAFDIVDGDIISATVNSLGCRFGELRIGFAQHELARIHLGEGSEEDESGVEYGVEAVSGSDHCDNYGVHHPVIATMESGGQRQALVVWLNELNETFDATQRAACGQSTKSVSIRALGLLIGGPPLIFPPELKAFNQGEPLDLFETTSFGPPSLVTWHLSESNSGYLLAYSNSKKNLEYAVIPAFQIADNNDLPNPFIYTPDNIVTYPQESIDDPIEDVAVAIGAPPEGSEKPLYLLAAYRTGCNADSRIRFALFDITDTDDTNGVAINLRFSDDLSVSNGGTIVEGPEVAFSDTGFYVPSGSNDNDPIGGWTVVWTERGNGEDLLLASRVSVLNGEVLILDETPYVLAKGTLSSPVVFTDQYGNVFFGAIDHCFARPIWGRTYCVRVN